MKLVIVTGLSGSGKSIALNTLEDAGYYCIDNLPLFLLPSFTEALVARRDPRYRLTAVGIDARNQSDLTNLSPILEPMKGREIEYEVIYLEARDDTLIKRYSETRRRHPLSDGEHPLAEAIRLERRVLGPFLDRADLRIDTTHTNVHQLRHIIRTRVAEHRSTSISILFESFGFKHGVPHDADFVYDLRCLPNPHWNPILRPLTGRDQEVIRFLENNAQVREMRETLSRFLEQWIPCFEADGRSYLTVAVGCTGGQHRSVYMAEWLSRHFAGQGRQVLTRHRELSA
ncbi:MAG TPA: RNase adapter RapZ [Sedimenticola sp.]|nr:RNase adapter RapZ [Sedimenticola sp.]